MEKVSPPIFVTNDGSSVFSMMLDAILRLDPESEIYLPLSAQYLGTCIRNKKRNNYSSFPSAMFTEEHFELILNFAFNRSFINEPIQIKAIKFIARLWTGNKKFEVDNFFKYAPNIFQETSAYIEEIASNEECFKEMCLLYALLASIATRKDEFFQSYLHEIDCNTVSSRLKEADPFSFAGYLSVLVSKKLPEDIEESVVNYALSNAFDLFSIDKSSMNEKYYIKLLSCTYSIFTFCVTSKYSVSFFHEKYKVLIETGNNLVKIPGLFPKVSTFFGRLSLILDASLTLNINVSAVMESYKIKRVEIAKNYIKALQSIGTRREAAKQVNIEIEKHNFVDDILNSPTSVPYEIKNLLASCLSITSKFDPEAGIFYKDAVIDYMLSLLINEEGNILMIPLNFFINIIGSVKVTEQTKKMLSSKLHDALDDVIVVECEKAEEKLSILKSILVE